MNPGGLPDYFGIYPNYALSPLPVLDVSGKPLSGGIHKFVDSLPGVGPSHANTYGEFIPLATKVAPPAGVPGDGDYYEIDLVDTTKEFHSDLAATPARVRIYKNHSDAAGHYLGPLIVAQRDRPVRVKFTNLLPTGAAGNLFIPVDTSVMGAGMGPNGVYPQNRATLHLHGGATPWISDGTPHQWITPAGEANYTRGVSQRDVPDMFGGKPPLGSATYYWTNQQSSRLMFYHAHEYGLTRLNVYAGEAAGYLVTDPAEDSMILSGAIPGKTMDAEYNYGIPLIIQEKTFVPSTDATLQFNYPGGQLAAQDPTWDTTKWGGPGSLWFPHVYMTNQNPADVEGVNAMGRWDYGAWFWPAQDPSTYVTGGQPYLCPSAAFPTQMCPGVPPVSQTPESFLDTPVVNGTAYPYLTLPAQAYRFRILNATNDRMLNLGLYYASDNSTGPGTPGKPGTPCRGAQSPSTCTEVNMVPAAPPTTAPPLCTIATPTGGVGLAIGDLGLGPTGMQSFCWPTNWPTDGRDGGVPDPATAGPAIIQIGTEGGLLPAPVVIPSTPTNYNYNRRDIVVLNVATHGLFLGPAERADVIVDFSSVPAGSTLILYNDAPAPVPAFDSRIDYYTGDPDQTAEGGAPSTTPGYGPNTRTIMQFRIVASPANPATVNISALNTAITAAYAATQAPPVVPELAYNVVPFPGTKALANTYSRIQNTSLTFTPSTCATPPCAPVTMDMGPKAIQELFSLDYGRMNATLGTELKFTNFANQTTIPYGYIDPITETILDGQPLIWKITHNGVDSHPVHVHLFNMQVINRVGWDGAVRAPDPNELGWKETVRMNPLEDVIVAFTPTAQKNLPFPMPDSSRPLDVTTTNLNSTAGFSNLDPTTGNAAVPSITNAMTNFGWEYVWHCHILGHEENDFMRPIAFGVAPEAPSLLSGTAGTGGLHLTWKDNSVSAMGFTVQRSADGAFTNPTVFTLASPTPVAYTDTTAGTTPWFYRVASTKSFGNRFFPAVPLTSAWSNTFVAGPVASVAPVSLTFPYQALNTTSGPQTVVLSNTGIMPLSVTSIAITGTNPGDFAQASPLCANLAPGTNCSISVTFTPTATGTRFAQVSVTSNDPLNPVLTVALTGSLPTPLASVSPASLIFPNQKLGVAGVAQVVTLSNTGTAALTVTSIGFTGLNAVEYTQTSPLCASVAIGANCAITVNFTPSGPGIRTAALSIVSNDPSHPTLSVPLKGGQFPPVAGTVSPASGAGTTQTFTATFTDPNGGTDISDARILINKALTSVNSCYVRYIAGRLYLASDAGSVWLGGFAPGSGSTSNSQCTLTGAGSSYPASSTTATLTANVTFTVPAFAGPKNIWLYAIDSTNLNTGLSLKGTWVASLPAPIATVSPATLSFANRALNTTSPAQTATLSNIGGSPLAVSNIALTGTNPGDFAISSNACSATLAAGANCTIGITSRPTAGGLRSAAVTVSSNDPVNPTLNVALNGMGEIAPQVGAISPATGSGTTNTFTATFTDANGGTDIIDARILINQGLSSVNACYVRYLSGKLYLMNDAGNSSLGGFAPGAGSVSNSQCTLSGAGSSYTAASYPGTTATLAANVTFKPAFVGAKSIWLFAIDSVNLSAGLTLKGTWTVQ